MILSVASNDLIRAPQGGAAADCPATEQSISRGIWFGF
jgi:hypothetical protein